MSSIKRLKTLATTSTAKPLLSFGTLLFLAGCAVVEPYPGDAYYYPPYPYQTYGYPRSAFFFFHHRPFQHHHHGRHHR